jgi:hypothetical protein
LIARYNHQRQSRRHHHITINKLFNFGIAKTTIGTRLNEAYKTIKEVKYRSKNNRCIFCGLEILFVCNKKKGNCFYLNEKKNQEVYVPFEALCLSTEKILPWPASHQI